MEIYNKLVRNKIPEIINKMLKNMKLRLRRREINILF